MTSLIFVYGTLKAGFPNAGRNPGTRVGGRWRTLLALPLYVVDLPGEPRAPWLVHAPGEGHPVEGELYAVDTATLAALDAFEEVGQVDGYARLPLRVLPCGGGAGSAQDAREVWAWCKSPAQLAAARAAGLPLDGPHPVFTAALARGYRLDG